MKKLLILSGKGGTGKTTIASSFIKLSNSQQFADCDVEAPNLHLMYKQGSKESKPYYGLEKALINQDACIACGKCYEHCRFNAIVKTMVDNKTIYKVDPFKCEGCGVCGFVCPSKAVSFIQSEDGSVDLYKNNYKFSTGTLKMGSGNSGLLVTEVKRQLKDYQGLTVIDGPPGIGCPVIASMSGVDFVLIVTEPSFSGFGDMKRMIQTVKRTRTDLAVCINKSDLNRKIFKDIILYLETENIPYVGNILYAKEVNDYINQGISLVETDHLVGQQIKTIYSKTMDLL